MKLSIRIFSLILGSLALVPAAAQAQQPVTVRLAMLAPNALLWPHAVAAAKGFYDKRGIKVEEARTAGSPSLLQAVSTGNVEAGMSLGDLALRAVDQGAPIIIAGAVMDKATQRLVGSKGFDDVKSLEGQVVSAGAVEGGTANLLRFMLQRAGVDPRGVKMMSISASSDRLLAMENGQVKGGLLTAPFDAMAVLHGMKIIDVYAEPYLTTPLIVNTTWANANRKQAEALTQGLQEAANWLNSPENREEAVRILAAYTKADPAICVDAYDFLIVKQKAVAKNLELNPASLENIVAIDKAVGAAPSSTRVFDLKRYYDPSFLAK